MQKTLKSLIREAFNTAYKQHKENLGLIKESSERLGSLLNPNEKSNADKVLNLIVTQSPGWEKYQWSPNGSQGLNQKEWNYIIEKIFELYKATGDEKYKQIIGNAYTYSPKISGVGEDAKVEPSALYNAMLPRLLANSGLERLMQKDPESLNTLLSKAWGRIFAGGKIDKRDVIDPKTNQVIKKGEKNVDAWKGLVDGYNSTNSNFGAYLYTVLFNDTKDLANSEVENMTTSLDAPSTITGKSKDVEDDDSIVGGTDPGLGDNFDDETEDGFQGSDTFASNGGADTEKIQQDHLRKINNWNKAVIKTLESMKTIPRINEKSIISFKEIMQDFLSYDEIALKHPDWIPNKQNKNSEISAEEKMVMSELNNKSLISAANSILAPYGLDYSIFKNPNWDEQFMGTGRIAAEAVDNSVNPLNPYDVVENIITLFSKTTGQGTSAKNRTIKVFTEFALNHRTPLEIASHLGLTPQVKEISGGDYIKSIIQNLQKSAAFEDLAWNIFREHGFDIDFSRFNWAAYWKAGKDLRKDDQATVSDENPTQEPETSSKYVWEQSDHEFMAENLEEIMKNVYKRLKKEI